MNFNNLHPELMQYVFKFLPFEKKVEMSSVCQQWFRLIFQDVKELTLVVIRQDYHHESLNKNGGGPRKKHCGNRQRLSTETKCSWRSNLDNLLQNYCKAFEKQIKPWELLSLFPQLKKLHFTTNSLNEDMLRCIEKYCTPLEWLSFTVTPSHGITRCSQMDTGLHLENLKFLRLSYYDSSPSFESGVELQLFRNCTKLEQVELSGITLSERCAQTVPSSVKHLSVKTPKDSKVRKQFNIFTFLCQNPGNLESLVWHVKHHIQYEHMSVLSRLRTLELNVNASLEEAIFEYCKKLTSLTLTEFSADSLRNLDPNRFALLELKHLSVDTFIGKPGSFTYLCPQLQHLEIAYMVLQSLDNLIKGVRTIDKVWIKRAGIKNSKLVEFNDDPFENVFFSENFHRSSHPSIFSIVLLKGHESSDAILNMATVNSSGCPLILQLMSWLYRLQYLKQ